MAAPLRRWFVLLVFATGLSPVEAQGPALYRARIEPKDIELRTDWYGIYLKERKIGYARTGRTRLADGTISEAQLTHLKLVSFGQKSELRMEQTFIYEGTAPYRLLRGELISSDSNLASKKTLTRAAKGYEVIHEGVGVRQKQGLEDLEYGLPDAMAEEMWVRSGPKERDKIAFTSLDLTEPLLKIDVQTCTVLGRKTSLAGGVEVHVYEIENAWRGKDIKSLSRLDSNGVVLSDQVAIFEMRLEPEAKAKDTHFSQDLFVMGMAKIDGALGNPVRVREMVIEVQGDEGGLADGPRQALVAGPDGKRQLKLGKGHGKPARVSEQALKDNLAETSAYPISDPRIQKLAREAVGDAQEPTEKVRRLVKFTHDYIKPSLSANLPQVHDLLERKKGDCKSYALLLTNLARAAGVPTREISGLLYVGDDYKAFGGHAWNEVALDGVWVPVDASLNETEVNATHISFGSDQRAIANLLNTLGKLSFRLVDVKRDR
jgi:hypothetical protein